MRISDWSSDVCSSDVVRQRRKLRKLVFPFPIQGHACLWLGWPMNTERIGHMRLDGNIIAPAVPSNTFLMGLYVKGAKQIGRAVVRERVCQYVWLSMVDETKKKTKGEKKKKQQ